MVSYLNLRNMVHRPPSQVRTFSLLPKDLTFIFLIPYFICVVGNHVRIFQGSTLVIIAKLLANRQLCEISSTMINSTNAMVTN